MTPILFYGVPSGCSFGSIVALEWLGEPYRLCRIEMPAVVTSEAYRRINPAAETPALLTADGRVVRESVAILNHLGARGLDRKLAFAPGTPEQDAWLQSLAFLNTSFFGAFSPLWYAYEHASTGEAKRVLTDYGRNLVAQAHANLDAMLRDRKWLLGEHRTLVDAYFIGIARWTAYHDVIDRRSYPNVQRLFQQLEADPAVQFAHAIEEQRPATSTGGFLGEVDLEEALTLVGRPGKA